jgi:hypothetical protein
MSYEYSYGYDWLGSNLVYLRKVMNINKDGIISITENELREIIKEEIKKDHAIPRPCAWDGITNEEVEEFIHEHH